MIGVAVRHKHEIDPADTLRGGRARGIVRQKRIEQQARAFGDVMRNVECPSQVTLGLAALRSKPGNSSTRAIASQ